MLETSDQTAEAGLKRGSALAQLRRDFRSQGWLEKATLRIVLELCLHIAIAIAGYAIFASRLPLGVRLFGGCLAGLGFLGIATNTHTSSHYATSSRRWVNEFLTHFGYSFCMGFPAAYWWNDHIAGHHSGPNVVGVDDDFDYMPLFAISTDDVARATGFRRWYYERCQLIFLLLSVPAMSWNLQRRGLIYLVKETAANPGAFSRLWPNHLGLILHVAVVWVLPSLFLPFSSVLVFQVLRMTVIGIGMFVILIPAHFPATAPLLTAEKARELDYSTLQTITSIDFDGGAFMRWISSGLDYQIEHHLFPEVSHPYYGKIAPFVEDYCREQGLPYRRWPLRRALAESLRVFGSPKGVIG